MFVLTETDLEREELLGHGLGTGDRRDHSPVRLNRTDVPLKNKVRHRLEETGYGLGTR